MRNKIQQKYICKKNVLLFLLLLSANLLHSQAKRVKIYEEYISTYKGIAIDHQNRYKIPASITLAQGLLESGAGKSRLARQGNNHFGIKCHKDWKGGKIYHDDDLANECFRTYKNAAASYEDHAKFIAERDRYASLFSLSIRDYKGWARGLQKLGYATDKAYANKLIKVIEDYQLYQYDNEKAKGKNNDNKQTTPTTNISNGRKHIPYKTHGLIYVFSVSGDSYDAIAAEFGFKVKDLYKYNEVGEDFPLKEGDIVYFEKKKNKADKPYYEHVVQIGESMHSISQRYGIKVKNLYKLNKKKFEYVPEEGDVLKLR